MTERIVLLAGVCLLILAGCSLTGLNRRADARTERPPAQVFGDALKALQGESVAAAKELEGIWHMSTIQQRAPMEHGVEPFLYYGLYLKLDADHRYQLVYQAYWGTRNRSDPRMHAVDVRESGVFSLSGKVLLLEPQATHFAQKRSGKVERQTFANENRAYLAALDGAYLNLAGRCAKYQVEPVCLQRRDVWYSLRFGNTDWPVPHLE